MCAENSRIGASDPGRRFVQKGEVLSPPVIENEIRGEFTSGSQIQLVWWRLAIMETK